MTDYLVLTEFVPGTKAKAEEVNANFSAVKDAINTKASMNGDSNKVFDVANGASGYNAINKAQLDLTEEALTKKINATYTRFCAKSGNITGGLADLLSYTGMNVTLKVGGTYQNLVISNYKGELTTLTSVAAISMTGKPNGTYNVFLTSSSTAYVLANTIYKQPTRPTMADGDVWLDTSVEPFKAIKYTSSSDVEFLDVPIGKITIASGAISAVTTFAYNQNGYDVNVSTFLKSMTSNGWAKLPNGLIIQWGEDGVATNPSTVVFPIAFSNAVFQIVACGANAGAVYVSVAGRNLTQFTAYKSTSFGIQWIAIGY